MKSFYILALVICCTIFSNSCKKHSNTNSDDTNVPGLPPATQTGENTFGCLVNGQPWVPEGSNGTPNLSIDYDLGFNNGIFGISAKRVLGPNQSYFIGLGISDSLNLLKAPIIRYLNKTGIFVAGYGHSGFCLNYSNDDSVKSTGRIVISLLDRNKKIIAGNFEFTIIGKGCDTIRVTKGRFDFKF